MIDHTVRTYGPDEPLARTDQLAWKIASVAAEQIEPTAEVTDMVINRIIDNAAVATAPALEGQTTHATQVALRRPLAGGRRAPCRPGAPPR